MMKKIFSIIVMILLISGNVFAVDWMQYSGSKTTDTAILETEGFCYGIIVSGSSTASGSVTLYDNASAASGSTIFPTIYIDANATEPRNIILFPPVPVKIFNGIYGDITTTAGTLNYEVFFKY